MTEFVFNSFFDYEDGKGARLQTRESLIPVNVYADDETDLDLQEGDLCSAEIYAIGAQDTRIFATEEDFHQAESRLGVPCMIPMGTFSLEEDDEEFEESSHILFVGIVNDVAVDPEAGPEEPNMLLLVETVEMELNLYIRTDRPVEKGNIVYGIAWLFGDIKKDR